MQVITLIPEFVRGRGIDTAVSMLLSRVAALDARTDFALWSVERAEGMHEDGFSPRVDARQVDRKSFCGFNLGSYHYALRDVALTQPTILHVHFPLSLAPILSNRSRLKQAGWVYTHYGHNETHWQTASGWWRRQRQRLVFEGGAMAARLFDKTIAISDYLRDQLIAKYRLPAAKVERIYLGIDTDDFAPGQDGGDYMLFVGQQLAYKRVPQLIRLAKALDKPLKIVGGGPYLDAHQKLAAALGAPVEFLVNIPKSALIRLYQGCRFYVSASAWEGLGLPPLEAMACGKPALVPDNTAHRETVACGQTGFRWRDRDHLLGLAQKLWDDAEMCLDLGARARERVCRDFSAQEMGAAHLSLYRSLF